MTTTQTSVSEWLNTDAPRTDHSNEPQDSTTTAELSLPVHLSNETYHRDVGGVPACPGVRHHLTQGTLREAVEQGLSACRKCQPARLEEKEGQ